MSEPGSSYPPRLVQYDNIFGSSLCWTTSGTYNNYYEGCCSTFFSTCVLNYTKVCGQVRGYQYGYSIGFYYYLINPNSYDPQIKWGVTLTYSNNPRKHIWTYAGGHGEQGTSPSDCPCNNGSPYMNYTIPFFVMITTGNQDVVLVKVVIFYILMIPSRMVRTVLDMRLPVVLLLRCHSLLRH